VSKQKGVLINRIFLAYEKVIRNSSINNVIKKNY